MPCQHQRLHWNWDRVVASPRVLLDCELQLTRDVSLSLLLRLELSLGLVVRCQVGGKAHKLIDLTADIVRIKARYKGSMVYQKQRNLCGTNQNSICFWTQDPYPCNIQNYTNQGFPAVLTVVVARRSNWWIRKNVEKGDSL